MSGVERSLNVGLQASHLAVPIGCLLGNLIVLNAHVVVCNCYWSVSAVCTSTEGDTLERHWLFNGVCTGTAPGTLLWRGGRNELKLHGRLLWMLRQQAWKNMLEQKRLRYPS